MCVLRYNNTVLLKILLFTGHIGKGQGKNICPKGLLAQLNKKECMWRAYRNLLTDVNYSNYKSTWNTATAEMRKKQNVRECKLAGNIKTISKSFCAYVRIKRNVCENSSDQIFTDKSTISSVSQKRKIYKPVSLISIIN